jgi:hypothetical protein
MSAVSPGRSLLATRPPEDLQHDRAAPARHRVPPPSRPCRLEGQVVPPLLKLVKHVRQRLHSVSPPFRSTAPIGRPTVSDNHRRLRRRSHRSNLAPRPIGRGSLGGGRGTIAAGSWSWHPGLWRCARATRRHDADRRRLARQQRPHGRRLCCSWSGTRQRLSRPRAPPPTVSFKACEASAPTCPWIGRT